MAWDCSCGGPFCASFSADSVLHRQRPSPQVDMKRSLFLCTALVGATACAAGLPPAPTATPVAAAVQDSLVPVVDLSALSNEAAAADAVVLNDLAAAVPDAAVIPAFDAQRVRWDIDVRTFAGHPRVQYYLSYFGSQARWRMEVFLARGVRYEPMILGGSRPRGCRVTSATWPSSRAATRAMR